MAQVDFPSWRALKQRVDRIMLNGYVERSPGSGRKSAWKAAIETDAMDALRAHGGEISKQEIYEQVVLVKRPKAMCRATFYHHLANTKKFKTRRLRLKPHLSEAQMEHRVRYAEYVLGLDEQTQQQIVCVDEKWFQAFASSIVTLPADDKTPEKFGISKTNQPKVMTLVCLMEPRGGFSGLVGQHLFTTRVAAERNSNNREAGTIGLKTVNVSAEQYLRAWEESILPRLKELQDQKLIHSSVAHLFCSKMTMPSRIARESTELLLANASVILL
jgi:hypothetical protein